MPSRDACALAVPDRQCVGEGSRPFVIHHHQQSQRGVSQGGVQGGRSRGSFGLGGLYVSVQPRVPKRNGRV